MASNPNPTPAGPNRKWPGNPWFLALGSCFLLAILLAARLSSDFDLGFHLRGGQWMVQHHRFFGKDAYTYTVPDHDYLDMHWLYQILLYTAYRIGGYGLLSILNIALICFVFVLTFLRIRLAGAPLWMCAVLLGVVLLSVETRFQVRPEIASWALMCLMLLILEWREGQKRDLLSLLPFLQLAWANLEGLFALGWVILGAHLLGNWIHSPRVDRKLLKASALSAAACLANPYFLGGFLFPLTHLLTLSTSNVFRQNISEFQPSWAAGDQALFHAGSYLATYKVFSFFLLFLIAATLKRRKAGEIILAGAFFYLSVTAVRNVSLFMLAAAPLAARCWKDLTWEWLRKAQGFFYSRPAAWIFLAFTLLFGLRVCTNAYYVSDHRQDRIGLGLDDIKQPVEAVQFLKDHGLDGRLLNQVNQGGWLDWQGPQKVFVDGRLEVMGEEFFSEYESSNRPGGLEKTVDKYHPDIIFFNPLEAPYWIAGLARMLDWRLAYLDGHFAIFLRKGYAPQIPELDGAGLMAKEGVDPALAGEAPAILQAPHPPEFQTWLQGFVRPQAYPEGLFSTATFYFEYGHPREAEAYLLEAVRRSGGKFYDLYLNLAALYLYGGQTDLARICVKRVLEDSPQNAIALQILRKLP